MPLSTSGSSSVGFRHTWYEAGLLIAPRGGRRRSRLGGRWRGPSIAVDQLLQRCFNLLSYRVVAGNLSVELTPRQRRVGQKAVRGFNR
jgi:hypothetical protein